jgi:uncharacterized protein
MTISSTLSIVTLGVAELDRSIVFYTALGWRRASASVEGAISWFDLGGAWLGLYPFGELAVDSGLPAGPPPSGFCGVTLAITLPAQAAVDDAVATAAAAGAVVTQPAVMTDYGVYHACFADPDGYVWEVAHNPGFPIVDGRTIIP